RGPPPPGGGPGSSCTAWASRTEALAGREGRMALPRRARQGPNAGGERIQRGVGPPGAALTARAEPRRPPAARNRPPAGVPAVLDGLADRLVDLLDGARLARQQALASLVQLGHQALPSLTRRFTRTRSVALQSGIVEVLGRIARDLGPGQRFDVMTELLIL